MRYVLGDLIICLPEQKHSEMYVTNIKSTRTCYELCDGFYIASFVVARS